MRTIITSMILALSLMVGLVNAQDTGNSTVEPFSNQQAVGGYISLGIGNTIINNENALLGQFRIAARLGHGFSIGLAGSGFTDCIYGLNYDRPQLSPEGYYIEGGYGGLLLEPVFAPDFPVHLSFPILIGAGGVAFTESQEDYDWNEWEFEDNHYVLESKAFLVVEPGVELEFNLSRFVRMGAGISYRFTNSIAVGGKREHLLNGITGAINLKVGIF
ncbi:MAG: hypothetical protein HGA37_02895 [Lentimicrobium sp.]|nr:hypothetical protein [Lentimicrobium sp.]